MTTSDVPGLMVIAFFGLLMIAAWQLSRIQVEAIGHSRSVSSQEARKIYYRDYADGDGATFSWREMRAYSRSTNSEKRLYFWCVVVLISIAGCVGAVILDRALR